METTLTTFSELRKIAQLVQRSIDSEYLNESWRETIQYNGIRNYEDIVYTQAGYYAHTDDCTEIDGEYYHIELDEDDIAMDEITNEYILSDDSRWVLDGRSGGFYTHYDNCESGHDIYEHNGDYFTTDYMEYHSLVFDYDGDIRHIDDVYYWESTGEYHNSPENDDDDDDDESN
jgi:hypothetical protein